MRTVELLWGSYFFLIRFENFKKIFDVCVCVCVCVCVEGGIPTKIIVNLDSLDESYKFLGVHGVVYFVF